MLIRGAVLILSMAGLVAGDAAYAASCVSPGNNRKSNTVRVLARSGTDTVYQVLTEQRGILEISASYQRVGKSSSRSTEQVEIPFVVFKDRLLTRCVATFQHTHLEDRDGTAYRVRFEKSECYRTIFNEQSGEYEEASGSPNVEVSCTRNYNSAKMRLTVRYTIN